MAKTRAERLRTTGAAVALLAALAITAGSVINALVTLPEVVVAFGLLLLGFVLYAWDSPARTVRTRGADFDPRSAREQRTAAVIWSLAWAPVAVVVFAVHSVVVTVGLVAALVCMDRVWLAVARHRH